MLSDQLKDYLIDLYDFLGTSRKSKKIFTLTQNSQNSQNSRGLTHSKILLRVKVMLVARGAAVGRLRGRGAVSMMARGRKARVTVPGVESTIIGSAVVRRRGHRLHGLRRVYRINYRGDRGSNAVKPRSDPYRRPWQVGRRQQDSGAASCPPCTGTDDRPGQGPRREVPVREQR